MKIKFFTNLIKWHNKNTTLNLVSGFTIIEALVAIFILTVSVSSMLGVTATSSSYSRYSNNEITANYLLQEAIDSVRNSRDTIAFQMKDDPTGGWISFLNRYGYNDGDTNNMKKCFSTKGCYLKIEKFKANDLDGIDVSECNETTNEGNTLGCPFLYYDEGLNNKLFYNYTTTIGSESIFDRKVEMFINADNINEVRVKASIEWNNGNGMTKMNSKILETYLLNWQN